MEKGGKEEILTVHGGKISFWKGGGGNDINYLDNIHPWLKYVTGQMDIPARSVRHGPNCTAEWIQGWIQTIKPNISKSKMEHLISLVIFLKKSTFVFHGGHTGVWTCAGKLKHCHFSNENYILHLMYDKKIYPGFLTRTFFFFMVILEKGSTPFHSKRLEISNRPVYCIFP